jgi:phenylalanyl-tRNA synthetase beta chain
VDSRLDSVAAMERATALLLAIAGGSPGPASVSGLLAGIRIPAVALRRERLAQLLGHQVPDAEVVDILQRLDMLVEAQPWGWQVQAASFRFDIAIEVDLIEEIARIRGYDRIGELAGQQSTRLGSASDAVVGLDRLKNVLVERAAIRRRSPTASSIRNCRHYSRRGNRWSSCAIRLPAI